MAQKRLPAIHPDEILLEEFFKPMAISQYRIAKDINVPTRRINEIVHGKRSTTANTEGFPGGYGDLTYLFLSLARAFCGLSPRFKKCSIFKITHPLPVAVRSVPCGNMGKT